LWVALLIIVCEVGAAPLPPSITAEDLTDTLHVRAPSAHRSGIGQQLTHSFFVLRSSFFIVFVFRFSLFLLWALGRSRSKNAPATANSFPSARLPYLSLQFDHSLFFWNQR
jgi:hypothetical protein